MAALNGVEGSKPRAANPLANYDSTACAGWIDMGTHRVYIGNTTSNAAPNFVPNAVGDKFKNETTGYWYTCTTKTDSGTPANGTWAQDNNA
jgi:hypothetical protein